MFKRIRLIVFTLTASLAFLISCKSSQHSYDEKYFLVSANIKIPYWETAGAGFSQAASQLGVRAEFVGPDTYDPQAERQELQRVAKLKPSGILISAAEAGALKDDIDAAIAAGVPVITLDSDAPQSKRLVFIGTNNYEAGLMGGRLAAKKMQGKGNVAVFTIPGQPNLDERLNGYRQAFASSPGIKIVEVVDIKGSGTAAFEHARDIINKYKGKIDGFICLEALSGKEVADVLDRQQLKGKTVVAMDTDDGTLQWIRKGVIEATIAQKPFTMAYYGLKMLDDLHHHPRAVQDANLSDSPFSPLPAFVDTGATLIDKSNLDDFIKTRDATMPKQR